MSAFRWLKMSLFLMLLYLTAVTGQYSSFVVRDGDEVALPCENVTCSQNECGNTSWLFSGAGNTPTVELVGRGQVGEKAEAKSDRLSVTANCSLVIKKVTAEDAGRYTCRQFRTGQQQVQDAHAYLSVINLDEYEDQGKVLLSCTVSTYAWCSQRVKWLFEGKDVDKVRGVKTSESSCLASVLFMTSQYIYTSRYRSFMCEVTDIYTGTAQHFTFSTESSGEDATRTPGNNDTTQPQGWWRLIIVSVGLAALLISVVAVSVWTRSKGNKTQTNQHTVHKEEDGDTVNYENLGDLYAFVRLP